MEHRNKQDSKVTNRVWGTQTHKRNTAHKSNAYNNPSGHVVRVLPRANHRPHQARYISQDTKRLRRNHATIDVEPSQKYSTQPTSKQTQAPEISAKQKSFGSTFAPLS
jgi:hypothetical protein